MKVRFNLLLTLLGLCAAFFAVQRWGHTLASSPAHLPSSSFPAKENAYAATAPTSASPAGTAAAPFKKVANTGLDSDVWKRLRNAIVVAVRDEHDEAGNPVRVSWARFAGKYPEILVRETSVTDPRTGLVSRRQTAMVADHLLVKRKNASEPEFVRMLERAGMRILSPSTSEGLYLVSFGDASLDALPQALGKLEDAEEVAYAEPDYLVFANQTLAVNPASAQATLVAGATGSQAVTITNSGNAPLSWSVTPAYTRPAAGPAPHAAVTPNDTYYSVLYALKSTGIDATHAWSITTGSAQVKVAVLDTGVDAAHPDLAGNLDLASAWNFVVDTNDPADDHGHGTHVAGTIAARGNNGVGVTGVTWSCKIVPLKFLDGAGSGYLSDAVRAINYAASLNIRILSNSWGGGVYMQSLHDAIQNSGALFVVAAGNDGANVDATPGYPAAFDCPNILSVAATDSADALAAFSNYGATVVDLAAPGVDIGSTYPANQYVYMSGTSMATPHVSGAAALLLSRDPTLTPQQLKQILMASTDAVPALAGKTVTGGVLNVYTALRTTYASWAHATTLGGVLAAGNSQPLSIVFQTQGLAVGQYTQNFQLTSNDPAHLTMALPVSLDVVAATVPIITRQPEGQMVNAGGSASFSVTASSTSSLSYQWQFNGANIPGANAASYSIPAAPVGAAGAYRVVVTDAAGSVTSSTAALLITQEQPQAAQTETGGSVSFVVTPSGTGPFSYQWQLNGTDLPGATSARYDLTDASEFEVGNYTVFVTTPFGTVTSKPVAFRLTNSLRINFTGTTDARWRIDGGAWIASGEPVYGISAAVSHSIEYAEVPNFAAPPTEQISVPPRAIVTLNRAYTDASTLARVTVVLTPNSAQWRIDGGVWRNSGTTATGLTAGTHTLEYSALSNYIRPSNETINLTAGQDLQLSRTYTADSGLAQLKVTLNIASGQWRVDGGTWKNSGATITNLSVGAHTIEYKFTTGYSAPATETIELPSGLTSLTRNYTQLAQLTVTLNTGQWNLDGGSWKNSGTTLTNLTPGSHTIAYKFVSGYTTPPTETIALVAGANSISRSYAPAGQAKAQLTLTLTPANGQWRVDGGVWLASGATAANLVAGDHNVEYNPVMGYASPAAETVNLAAGQALALSRNYAALPAQLSIMLDPADGQWRVDGGAWQASGATLTNLVAGNHSVEFGPLPGYTSPAAETIALERGQALAVSRNYVELPAQLAITLTPASAQWRVDGGVWRDSGVTVIGLKAGAHSIDYSNVTGYIPPNAETVSLARGEMRALVRENIAIVPKYSVTPLGSLGGGTSHVDGLNLAGTLVGTSTTGTATHMFRYRNGAMEDLGTLGGSIIAAWAVNDAGTIVGEGTNASGQWRAFYYDVAPVELGTLGGPSSAAFAISENGLIVGTSYRAASGPESSSHAFLYASGSMQDLGALAPLESRALGVNDAGVVVGVSHVPVTLALHAFRYAGGSMQDLGTLGGSGSGAIAIDESGRIAGWSYVSGDTAYHAFSYQDGVMQDLGSLGGNSVANDINNAGVIVGDSSLASGGSARAFLHANGVMRDLNYDVIVPNVVLTHAVSINDLGQIAANGSDDQAYLLTPLNAPGGLRVSLTPASAQWRVDSGNWQSGGGAVLGLAAGSHTVEYASVATYSQPPAETVTIASGQLTELTRAYTLLPAQLTVTLTPSKAQWRLDGGAWQNSGTTLANLSLGSHSIEYATLSGYTAPATESITLSAGQSLALSRSYVASGAPAALKINLNLSTGQWRVDTGVWKNSGASVLNLAPGAHTVDYKFVSGYSAPASETLTLPSGTTTLERSYQQRAQLTVTLNTGQWRLDGGSWKNSGTTLTDLALGTHTIDYKFVSGFKTPPSETLSLPAGATSLSRTYSPQ